MLLSVAWSLDSIQWCCRAINETDYIFRFKFKTRNFSKSVANTIPFRWQQFIFNGICDKETIFYPSVRGKSHNKEKYFVFGMIKFVCIQTSCSEVYRFLNVLCIYHYYHFEMEFGGNFEKSISIQKSIGIMPRKQRIQRIWCLHFILSVWSHNFQWKIRKRPNYVAINFSNLVAMPSYGLSSYTNCMLIDEYVCEWCTSQSQYLLLQLPKNFI